jgi:hypothetical protein
MCCAACSVDCSDAVRPAFTPPVSLDRRCEQHGHTVVEPPPPPHTECNPPAPFQRFPGFAG